MSRSRRHPAPAPLTQRGMTHAVESAPGAGGFRVRHAGTRIAVLFREELMQRQAARTAAKAAEALA